MAKTSAIQKNLKRIKLVKKYAKKRAALKKIINNRKLELSERFEAQEIDARYQEGLMVFIEN